MTDATRQQWSSCTVPQLEELFKITARKERCLKTNACTIWTTTGLNPTQLKTTQATVDSESVPIQSRSFRRRWNKNSGWHVCVTQFNLWRLECGWYSLSTVTLSFPRPAAAFKQNSKEHDAENFRQPPDWFNPKTRQPPCDLRLQSAGQQSGPTEAGCGKPWRSSSSSCTRRGDRRWRGGCPKGGRFFRPGPDNLEPLRRWWTSARNIIIVITKSMTELSTATTRHNLHSLDMSDRIQFQTTGRVFLIFFKRITIYLLAIFITSWLLLTIHEITHSILFHSAVRFSYFFRIIIYLLSIFLLFTLLITYESFAFANLYNFWF